MVVHQPDVHQGPKLPVHVGQPAVVLRALHRYGMANQEVVRRWRRELSPECPACLQPGHQILHIPACMPRNDQRLCGLMPAYRCLMRVSSRFIAVACSHAIAGRKSFIGCNKGNPRMKPDLLPGNNSCQDNGCNACDDCEAINRVIVDPAGTRRPRSR